MLTKEITYTDYNGNERTEKFYFNLNEAELSEMEFSTVGGLTEYVQRIAAAQDTPAIIAVFKELILKSYGEKSLDGRHFVKENGKRAAAFAETEAYSVLFMELATDQEKAAEFFNGIVPKPKAEQANNVMPMPTNN